MCVERVARTPAFIPALQKFGFESTKYCRERQMEKDRGEDERTAKKRSKSF